MIAFNKGLGSTDLGPLGNAFFRGQLQASFLPTQYFQPAYMPEGQLSAIPESDYATDSFASQLASLLNGSVTQAPPPGNLNGKNIPMANWVRLSDGGMVLPGNVVPAGIVLSFPDECTAEREFQGSIPGGVLSAACAAGGSGLTPTQMATAVQNPVPDPGAVTIQPFLPPITPTIPVNLPAPTAGITPAPSTAPPQSNGSSVVPVTSAPTTTTPAATTVSGSSCDWKSVFGGQGACNAGPIDWSTLLTDTDIGIVPNWVWAAGLVVGTVFFSGKGRR